MTYLYTIANLLRTLGQSTTKTLLKLTLFNYRNIYFVDLPRPNINLQGINKKQIHVYYNTITTKAIKVN